MPTAVFRCDASPAIGGGHVMRCLALADELNHLGWRCAFAVSPETLATVPMLGRAGHTFGGPEEIPAGADWLIVDHYGIGVAEERAYRSRVAHIMVIADLADRAHDCDVLLDQNPGRRAEDYAGCVPTGCTVLTGAGYALLRAPFGAWRDTGRESKRDGFLLAFGATDPTDLTSIALDAVATAKTRLPIGILLGSKAEHRERVEARAKSLGARLYLDLVDPVPVLTTMRLAIGAAGVSALERCAIGVPSLVVVAAENQRLAATSIAKLGAAEVLSEPTADTMTARLCSLDADRIEAMARAASTVCDGRGARRTAMVLAPEAAGDGAAVRLRPATQDDAALMLGWQKAPETRRHAFTPAIPSEAEHCAWLERKLADPDCLLNVVLHGEREAGVLRLDRASGDRFEVSIYLAPGKHRLGIGRAALALARRLVRDVALIARIKPENRASLALFASAGYVAQGDVYVVA